MPCYRRRASKTYVTFGSCPGRLCVVTRMTGAHWPHEGEHSIGAPGAQSPRVERRSSEALDASGYFARTTGWRDPPRFIAATNASLAEGVTEGRFRQDLLQRLSACHIELPALRDRLEDIFLIAEHVLKAEGHSGAMTDPVRALLGRHEWNGNVAELEGAMRFAAVAARGEPLRISHLPDALVEETYPPPGTASQILLTAQVLDTGAASEGQDMFAESLDAVLTECLKEPPPIASDEEVDELVSSFVQLAFMWPGNQVPLTPGNLQTALHQLRTVSLLSELRQQVASGHFSNAVESNLQARLEAELQDVKGPPLLGMGIQVLMMLLESDDPESHPKLREWALKFRTAAPMIVHLFRAMQKSDAPADAPTVTTLAPRPVAIVSFAKAPGTTNWMDPQNRSQVEMAVRKAGGVKQQAGDLLNIKSPTHIAKVIKAHGLDALCAELTQRRREGGARAGSPDGASRGEEPVALEQQKPDSTKGGE